MGAAIEQPCLFDDLPAMEKPKLKLNGQVIQFVRHRRTTAQIDAEKKLLAEMQIDWLIHLLSKSVIRRSGKRAKKVTKRALEIWEDTKAFAGSVTIFLRPTLTSSEPVLTDWSNVALIEAHRWVFDESMEALKAEDNPEEKMDVLEWVFSPTFIEKLGKSLDGRPCIIRRRANEIPFSFENCCRAIGIKDPDTYREDLVEKMNDELKPLLRKYLAGFTGKRHF